MKKTVMFAAVAALVSASAFADVLSGGAVKYYSPPSIRVCGVAADSHDAPNSCRTVMDHATLYLDGGASELRDTLIAEFKELGAKRPIIIAMQQKLDSRDDKVRLEEICVSAGVECRIRDVPLATGSMVGTVTVYDQGGLQALYDDDGRLLFHAPRQGEGPTKAVKKVLK